MDVPEEADKKKKKKKAKVRSAWISFVGRIVAQVIGAAATVALGLAIAGRIRERETPPAAPPPSPRAAVPRPSELSLVVLPLENLSGRKEEDYFADGMTEALITDLAQMRGIRVISRTSSMRYKGHARSMPEIADELGVQLVIEGSVAQAGENVRVTAQLIDARRDAHLWARSYDRRRGDVLALQGEIATAIAREVKGALSPAQQARLAAPRPVDPEAYDLYLRGRHAWNERTPEGLRSAVEFLERAVLKDPEFALAHAALADAYSLSAAPGDAGRVAQAKSAASRALALDENLAEAHASLAAAAHWHDADGEGAERGFKKALALHPGYASAHQWYAILLSERGRHSEALAEAEAALRLDPLSGPMRMTVARAHYYARRYEDAVTHARSALTLAPRLTRAREVLVKSLTALARAPEAVTACDQAPPQLGDDLTADCAAAYHKAGDRARAWAALKPLLDRPSPPFGALARFYAATADGTTALHMLERAPKAVVQSLVNEPALDGVRGDARFRAVQQRVGLT